MCWTCLPDGHCDYRQPAMGFAIPAFPRSSSFGFGWLEQIDRRSRAGRRGREAASRQQTTLDADFRIRGADGAHRWFKARADPLRDSEGHVVKWFGTTRDMTTKNASKTARAKFKSARASCKRASPP